MSKPKLVVLGAGGHAKVVIEALRSAGARPWAALDPDPKLKGRKVEGVRVAGGDEVLEKASPRSTALANGVGGMGVRRRVFERLRAKGFRFPAVTAASAVVARSVRLAEGAQVLTRAVVHPGATVGENAVVNTMAVVEHDCEVGAHAFVGPGAILLGGVSVGPGAFIGAGAVVLPLVKIGAGATVGAGAVVVSDVPSGAVVAGVPARRLKDKR